MLRSVLADYLDKVGEREFDLPLLFLLPALGYYDVHFTHGQVEFGKDFIAKKNENGAVIQYSFQSKAGDISQRAWRNDVQGQLLEAVLTPLSHPNFDTTLPHQSVLITTGNLKGNAALSAQSLNNLIRDSYRKKPIVFWEKECLIESLLEYGLEGIIRSTEPELENYGRFFLQYGQALQGQLSDRQIEDFSRTWSDSALDYDQELLRATLQAELLTQQCSVQQRHYEAVVCQLALLRTLFEGAYCGGTEKVTEGVLQASQRLRNLCTSYLELFEAKWEAADRDLNSFAVLDIYSYPVHCSRVLDIVSLVYFLSADKPKRQAATFLQNFVEREPGCSHLISDRYAVSLVLGILVLCDSGDRDAARKLLGDAAAWLGDRYESGSGLAGLEGDELEEIRYLVGYAFEAIDIPERDSSFLATALCDLAAFLGDQELYTDIVNDIKACDIIPEYYQPIDTLGVCRVDGADVRTLPWVAYEDELSRFSDARFGSHLFTEADEFAFISAFGATAAVLLMTLLRDRYFPKLWPAISPSTVDTESV